MKRLTVVCVTYNHEKYIRQALDGILMQKVNFDFEVLVGDDASTDKTPEIIREYAKKYPDIIKPVLRRKNVGAAKNSIDLYKRVKTEYVAVCDGDDYWCDPDKLQKQVDFLDKNPDYATVFGKSREFFDDGSREDSYLPSAKAMAGFAKKGYLDASDILHYNDVTPCSLMWRWALPNGFPKWYDDEIMGDLALNLIHAKKGKVGFIPEVMSCYRRHSGGMWQGAEDFTVSYKKYGAVFVNTFIHLRDYYGGAYQEDFNRAIGHVFWLRFLIAQKDKDVDSYVKFITRFFSEYLEIMEGLYGKTESSYLKKKIRRLRRWRKVLLIGLGLIFIVLIAILFRFIKC